MATEVPPTINVPEGFRLHTENTSHILLPNTKEAFLNPVQEFNRDLSVASIRVWSEEMNRLKEQKWRQAQEKRVQKDASRKRAKLDDGKPLERSAGEPPASAEPMKVEPVSSTSESIEATGKDAEFRPQKFVLLEALSATGLRSIRYAKEIPLVKYVIANDLSSSATAAMKRNVDLNGLGGEEGAAIDSAEGTAKPKLGKVRINEGDARALMYSHTLDRNRVDVVDLDPYGTAAPFIDSAVQCVNDGGLLCVTCTDLSVLATNNYPEKCYSNYGGIPVKAEYCHEVALRLVLNSISVSAARYGRFIEPLLSLSIDFYVRIFVRIQTAPVEVKKAASKTSIFYVCSTCQSSYGQPLSKVIERESKNGTTNPVFKTHTGPTVSEKCPECGSAMHLAGPMWNGPIQDPEFVGKVLQHVESNEDKYGTVARMKGMLTVAKEELNVPFFFTPTRVSSFFHCNCPSLDDVTSALLNAGHQVSRSHACPGSIKTTASRRELFDIFLSWVKLHPVKMEKIAENSPSRVLLAREPAQVADFKRHPKTHSASSKVKLVRYQVNPTPNWGPGAKADAGTHNSKRKRDADE